MKWFVFSLLTLGLGCQVSQITDTSNVENNFNDCLDTYDNAYVVFNTQHRHTSQIRLDCIGEADSNDYAWMLLMKPDYVLTPPANSLCYESFKEKINECKNGNEFSWHCPTIEQTRQEDTSKEIDIGFHCYHTPDTIIYIPHE